jgi:hypothetical protein
MGGRGDPFRDLFPAVFMLGTGRRKARENGAAKPS